MDYLFLSFKGLCSIVSLELDIVVCECCWSYFYPQYTRCMIYYDFALCLVLAVLAVVCGRTLNLNNGLMRGSRCEIDPL